MWSVGMLTDFGGGAQTGTGPEPGTPHAGCHMRVPPAPGWWLCWAPVSWPWLQWRWEQLARMRVLVSVPLDDCVCELVSSLILSHLDYCNSLLAGHLFILSPNTLTDSKLCSPLSSKEKKFDHITPLFRTLHWLPIHSTINCKLNTLCHKCIINLAPEYPCSCLHLYTPSRTLRSSSDTLTLKIPQTKLSSAAQHAFTSTGPSTWNKLWL